MSKTISKSKIPTDSTTVPSVYTGGKSYYEYCWEPDCEYKDKCTSKGYMCYSCKHNKKRNYYEPDYPLYPYEPIYPIITCGGGIKWG